MRLKNNTVNPELITNIEFYTKLSKEQRKKLINWFNKQNIEFQILIFDEQKNQYFKLKNENIDKKLLSLASFLLAIKHFNDKELVLKFKNKSQSLNELGNISKIEKIKLKKEKTKEKLQAIMNIHNVVEELHNDNYSSREIKGILLTKYRKEFSHTYINSYIKNHIINNEVTNV